MRLGGFAFFLVEWQLTEGFFEVVPLRKHFILEIFTIRHSAVLAAYAANWCIEMGEGSLIEKFQKFYKEI